MVTACLPAYEKTHFTVIHKLKHSQEYYFIQNEIGNKVNSQFCDHLLLRTLT